MVATSTRDFRKTSDKIISCLKGYPEGLSPKLIAYKTGLNVNSVKSALPKIAGIKKVMRGLYRVANGGDGAVSSKLDLSDWNFHNCVLTAVVPDGVPLTVSCGLDVFGLVKATLDVFSSSRKAVFRVSSDWPLNVSSIAWVAYYFADLICVPCEDVMVSTVEFNYDYRNLRLDGVKSISVDSLVEQFKVYQKRRGLRVEHKTKVPVSVDTVVDMLRSVPNSVELHDKLNEQRRVLDRLVKAVSIHAEVVERLLPRVR